MAGPFSLVWFYNSESGSVIEEPALGDTIQSHLPGWHGPFGTKAEALAYYQSNAAANPSWKPPGGISVSKVAGTATQQITNAATSVTSDVLKPLFQANIWIRVVEVGLGLLLIAIGVAKITKAVPIATRVAKTAGAVALA